jgi:hypothetical protein
MKLVNNLSFVHKHTVVNLRTTLPGSFLDFNLNSIHSHKTPTSETKVLSSIPVVLAQYNNRRETVCKPIG